jgi:Ca2+-dependent lipid-binding protein
MASNELGTLVVVVLKARNLRDNHSFWKQDVYATVSLGGTKKTTKTDVKGGQHPTWDDEVRLPVLAPDAGAKDVRTLEVCCWSVEHKQDEMLGKGTVDISDTLKTGEFDGQYIITPAVSMSP